MEKEKKESVAKKDKNAKKRFTRKKLVVIISIIALIISYVIFRGNYLEIKEIGESYLPIFWRKTIYATITFVLNFVFLYCAFYLTNRTIKKGLQVFFDDEKKEMPKLPNKSISFVIALIGGAISTKILLSKIALFFSNSKFGNTDPVFNLDISFLVFQKPLIQFILIYLIAVTVATLAYGILYAIIALNISFDGVSRESIAKCNLIERIGSRVKIIAVLAALIVVFFMMTNIGNEKFMGIQLTDGTTYSLYGASKADITIKLWGYAILAILAMFSILRAYKAIKEKSVRGVIGNIMIVPVYLIALAVVLALYQLIFIGSNDLDANQKYIEANLNYTKKAYGIENNETALNYSGTITQNEINNNINILNNVNIVTPENVLQDLKTTQTVKGYYSYRKTQIEKYNINGTEMLAYITPREISISNTTYAGKTYEYTHGYGSIVTLAGSTDDDGYLKNIEEGFENLNNSVIPIKEPRIYFGLDTNNTIVVNSNKTEIDYIEEDSEKEIEHAYDGNAGLKLNWFDRLILAMKEGDVKLAFSKSVTSESKIITNRNVISRAKTVMPFLLYDEDPYMVIDDSGNQYWILDAYTVSNDYPFAQKATLNSIEEINYIRNSVKVIINAYDGKMDFYITDRNDPFAMAYNNMYPGLFKNRDEKIPEDISKHFVYPKKLYLLQENIVTKYHDIKSEVFYRGNDIWDIATTSTSGKEEMMTPYYTMVKNEENKDSLGLVIPFTAYGKQNLIGYMVGTVEDGKQKLKIYKFSSNSNVLGPVQLETQINQDEEIAAEIASLNVNGTKITKRMIAVPINNTILYVETIYQQLINESTQKPMLKRVVVASGNKVAIGNNLETALKNLLSQSATNIDVSNTEDMQDLVNAIVKANQNVKDSSKNSDWRLFGEDMQTLTNLIDQLEVLVAEQEKENENTNVTENENVILNENTIEESYNTIRN